MKQIILFLMVLLAFAGCKKEPVRNYSTWKVNGVQHTSNNVSESIGKAIAIFDCDDPRDRFDLSIYDGSFPRDGQFLLCHDIQPSQNPEEIVLTIYVNTAEVFIAAPSNNVLVTARDVDGKAQYTVPSGWFRNPYNREDSILVEGVFIEP